MKKLLCIFIILIIMLPCTSFAVDSTIEYNYKIVDRRVTVWGVVTNANLDTKATIKVLNKDEILYINQMYTQDGGIFEFVFNLPKDLPYGIYTLKLGTNTDADMCIGEISYSETIERKFFDCDLTVNINGYIPTISGTVTSYYNKRVNIYVMDETDNVVVYFREFDSTSGVQNISLNTLPSLLDGRQYRMMVECVGDGVTLFEVNALINTSFLLVSGTGSIKLSENVYADASVDSMGYGINQTRIFYDIEKELTFPNLAPYMSCNVKLTGYEKVQAEIDDSKSFFHDYSVSGNADSIKYVNIQVCDMPSISEKIFTVEYDPSELEVVDLCGFTTKKDTIVGNVENTDITIISFEIGKIVFESTKNVADSKIITGTINRIVFKKLDVNTSQVKCTVSSK